LIELKLRTELDAKESRHSRAEINSFEDEDPKPVPNHLLKKDQFMDDLFIIYQINQEPGSVVRCSFADFFLRIFQKSIFSSQITGNEVFNFISNIRHHWKTRLIGIIADQVQVQSGIWYYHRID